MSGPLFQYRQSYPDAPGFRDRDTSRNAARDMMPQQGTIQAMVLEALAIRPQASFELAESLGISYRSVQPRTAELARATPKRGQLIRDSGQRRIDPETGKAAIVWMLIA